MPNISRPGIDEMCCHLCWLLYMQWYAAGIVCHQGSDGRKISALLSVLLSRSHVDDAFAQMLLMQLVFCMSESQDCLLNRLGGRRHWRCYPSRLFKMISAHKCCAQMCEVYLLSHVGNPGLSGLFEKASRDSLAVWSAKHHCLGERNTSRIE